MSYINRNCFKRRKLTNKNTNNKIEDLKTLNEYKS